MRSKAFPAMREWGRDVYGCSSLADGKAGWGWVYLHSVRAGLVKEDARIRRGLFRSLSNKLSFRPGMAASHFIGTGAPVVLAASAAQLYPEYARLLEPLASHWLTSCDMTKDMDVMTGKAGALLACAEIHSLCPDLLPRDFVRGLHKAVSATTAGLIKHRRRVPVPLGLPHGLAGYLLALAATEETFGLKFGLRAACLDLLHEQAVSGPRKSASWPMLSQLSTTRQDEPVRFPNAWCHGAPGIGLALMCVNRWTPRRDVRALADAALNAAGREESGASLTFCCGTIGRAQVLIEAYRLTGQTARLRRARALVAGLGRISWKPTARGFHGGRLGEDYVRMRLDSPRMLPLLGLGSLSA